MSIFVLENFLKKINIATVEAGKEYFLLAKVKQLSFNVNQKYYYIKGSCNHYQFCLTIDDKQIIDHNCQCSQGKYQIVCKHLVAALYTFNEQLNIKIKNNFKLHDEVIDSNLIDLYKSMVEIDYLLTINIANTTFAIKFDHEKIFKNLKINYEQFSNIIKHLHQQHQTDLTLSKVKRMLDEYSLFISFFNETKNLYDGNDIDTLIKIISDNNIQYINILFKQNIINNINCIDSNRQLLTIDCEVYNTAFDYQLTFSMFLENYIYSNDYTYLLFNEQNTLFFYKINFTNVDDFKLLKKNLISSKKIELIEQKINALKSFNIFNVNYKNTAIQKQQQIIVEGELAYDIEKDLIKLQFNVSNNDDKLLYQLLAKKFGIKFLDNQHQKNTYYFYNDDSFDQWFLMLKDDDFFKFKVPSYFYQTSNTFSINLDINQQAIKINLKNQLIKNDEDFLSLKKATQKNKKFVAINNQIFLVKDFDLKQLQYDLSKYNIDDLKFSNNIVDFKNIFSLANEVDDEKIINYLNKINATAIDLNLPQTTLAILKPYQIDGIKWMKKYLQWFNGVILADEMGLGKTIQTLSLLQDYFSHQQSNKNILIVTPALLLQNWLFEIKKFDFDLQVINLVGRKQKRHEKIISNKNNNKIFITTYNQVVNDFEYIKDMHFEYIVLDEGQKIKYHNSQFSKTIRSLNAINRIFLSGTPIENNLMELWTIFDFILPHFLPPQSRFKKLYCQKDIDEHSLNFLKLQTSPFILKRTKQQELKNLPKKQSLEINIDLTPQEQQAYQKLLTKYQEKFNHLKTNDNVNALSIITKLRMYACYNNYGNGKLIKLLSLLDEIISKKSKVVVFCFFSSILEKISNDLNQKGIKHLLLVGKTTNRWDIINSFNNDNQISVLLCSLKTGGIGINLTAANYVINYSPWWNEASENQAIDRTHRLGQTRDITIYNLIANNTIEVDINILKKQKTILIDNIIHSIDYYQLLKDIFNKKT